MSELNCNCERVFKKAFNYKVFQTNAPDGCINFIYRTLQMTSERLTAVSSLEKGHHFLEGIQKRTLSVLLA